MKTVEGSKHLTYDHGTHEKEKNNSQKAAGSAVPEIYTRDGLWCISYYFDSMPMPFASDLAFSPLPTIVMECILTILWRSLLEKTTTRLSPKYGTFTVYVRQGKSTFYGPLYALMIVCGKGNICVDQQYNLLFVANVPVAAATATPFGFVDGKAECLSAFFGSGWPEVTKCLTSLDGACFRANGRRRLLRTLRIRFRPFWRARLIGTDVDSWPVFGNNFVVAADSQLVPRAPPSRQEPFQRGCCCVHWTASFGEGHRRACLSPSLQCLRGCVYRSRRPMWKCNGSIIL